MLELFKKSYVVKSLLAAAVLTSLSQANAQNLKIGNPNLPNNGIIAGGTGCPQGTYSITSTPDGSAVTVIYDAFQVAASGRNSQGQANKANAFCQLTIPMGIPAGWSFSILDVNYSGFANVPSGGAFRVMPSYSFSGQTPVSPRPFVVYGPFDNSYFYPTQVGILATSPCGGSANFSAKVRLEVAAGNNGAETTAGVDSTDLKAQTIAVYRLSWNRCR